VIADRHHDGEPQNCSISYNAPKGTTFAHIPLWEHKALTMGKWVSIKLGVTLRQARLMKRE